MYTNREKQHLINTITCIIKETSKTKLKKNLKQESSDIYKPPNYLKCNDPIFIEILRNIINNLI